MVSILWFFPSSTHPPLSLHHPTFFISLALSPCTPPWLGLMIHSFFKAEEYRLLWKYDMAFSAHSSLEFFLISQPLLWQLQWCMCTLPFVLLNWDVHAVRHATCKEKSCLVSRPAACRGFQPWMPQTQSILISWESYYRITPILPMGVNYPWAVWGFILILNFTSCLLFLNLLIFLFSCHHLFYQ